MTKKALILVDLQNDFLPGGSLAVKESETILPIINQLTSLKFDEIVATKDWHPQNHNSFAINHNLKAGDQITINNKIQILWPIHCVQESQGAEFTPEVNQNKIGKIFFKGINKNIDSYSAFFDNEHKKSTGLSEYLKLKKINELYIVGLTTDYCVKYSALDALKLGFKVFVIQDACRGVNLKPQDSKIAFQKMKEEGVILITSKSLLN